MSISMKTAVPSALAVALLSVTGVHAAPEAQAAERNLVAFGDSVLADPPAHLYLGNRVGGDLRDMVTSSRSGDGKNCPHSYNYAARAAAKLRLPVRDFSCAGATSMSPGKQISVQIDDAIATGALSPATQRVVFTSGFNDTYNNHNLSLRQVREKYVRFTAPQIRRIKRAAPNARIQIVGYASITSRGNICPFHIGLTSSDGSSQGEIPAPVIQDWEIKAQWMQVDLARATGTQFLDLKPLTAGNSMCAPDSRRMWAGLVDTSAGPGNMPLHMNARGHEFVANVIARS